MKVILPTSSIFLRQKLTFLRYGLIGMGDQPQKKIGKKSTKNKVKHQVFNWILLLISFFSFTLAGLIFAPKIYYSLIDTPTEVITPLAEIASTNKDLDQENLNIETYQPEKDESLPQGNWLVIPRIGVRSEMRKTATADEALSEGIWWVPDFGAPGDELPIILVAHRYGYQWWWKTDYWKYNSFYMLPDLEAGDFIEVISDQRKWVYEVYLATEGEQITDYDADLILYTCKYLDSPIKHFRYARLINPELNTQDN